MNDEIEQTRVLRTHLFAQICQLIHVQAFQSPWNCAEDFPHSFRPCINVNFGLGPKTKKNMVDVLPNSFCWKKNLKKHLRPIQHFQNGGQFCTPMKVQFQHGQKMPSNYLSAIKRRRFNPFYGPNKIFDEKNNVQKVDDLREPSRQGFIWQNWDYNFRWAISSTWLLHLRLGTGMWRVVDSAKGCPFTQPSL